MPGSPLAGHGTAYRPQLAGRHQAPGPDDAPPQSIRHTPRPGIFLIPITRLCWRTAAAVTSRSVAKVSLAAISASWSSAALARTNSRSSTDQIWFTAVALSWLAVVGG